MYTIGEDVDDEYWCVAAPQSIRAMLNVQQDQMRVLDTGRSNFVYAVVFHPDGKHLLSGNEDGVQRWRLADGQEVGRQTGMDLRTISVSREGNWIVCGTLEGASVWDGEIHAKVVDVEGGNGMAATDVSPDSTKFATGTGRPDNTVSIWSITTGQRLVGPLQHDSRVSAIKFSPGGEHIAIASRLHAICVFDSRNGDKLITVDAVIPQWSPITPLAWSSDGQRIVSACRDNKIRAFDSTGSQLAESQILGDGSTGHNVYSIALAANGKFVASLTSQSTSFLDTSTLEQIGPVIKDSQQMRSIAMSPNSKYLATGKRDGKILIQDLGNILPDSYGPFHVSSVCLRHSGMLDTPHPVPHADKLLRCSLVKTYNKTQNRLHRGATTTMGQALTL